MKKKFLSILLSLAMLLTLLPTTVWATDELPTCDHESWVELATLSSSELEAGNYVLTDDLVIGGGSLQIRGVVNLCLNGHSITMSHEGNVDQVQVITLMDNSTVLNLFDCNVSGIKHDGYLDADGLWCVDADGAHNGKDDEYDIDGGLIWGSRNNISGGGVYNNYGTFNMYGGTIAGNTAGDVGGGVYNYCGTFNMYGGAIVGNTAGTGGGVYNYYGTFNMYGGMISGNRARKGGGVYMYGGMFNMSGNAVVTNNHATSEGGGVQCTNEELTLSGGAKIVNNTCGENNTKSNLCFYTYSESASTSASITINDATEQMEIGITGRNIEPGETWKLAGADFAGTFTTDAADCAVSKGTDGVYLKRGGLFAYANDYGRNYWGENPGSRELSEDPAFPGASEDGYQFKGWYTERVGGVKKTVFEPTERLYAHWDYGTQKKIEVLTETLFVAKDHVELGDQRLDKDNAAVLTRYGLSIAANGDDAITVTANGAHIRVPDRTYGTPLAYVDGGLYAQTGYIGGVYVGEDATFVLQSGSITGNIACFGDIYAPQAAYEGGGVFVANGGTFKMPAKSTGVISGNMAYSGGGVFVANGGKFEMHGGSITENGAMGTFGGGAGGGVAVELGGTLEADGGKIEGNMAAYLGGGVYVAMGCANEGIDGAEEDGFLTCLAAGTPITLADGTRTAIENLEVGDSVRVFDHETGALSAAKLFDLWKFPQPKTGAFTLHFTNGIDVTAVGGHCFFDKTANKYVDITTENVNGYIGHKFYNADAARWETLESVTFLTEAVDTYIIVSEKKFNTLANGMLANVDGMYTALCNIFDFDESLKIDAAQKAADVAQYGLWDYDAEHFQYVTEETYEALELKYLGVALGKGLLTAEELAKYAENTVNLNTDLVRPEMLGDSFTATAQSVQNDAPEVFFATATSVQNDPVSSVILGGTVQIKGNLSQDLGPNNLALWEGESNPKIKIGTETGNSQNGVKVPSTMSVGVTLLENYDFAEGVFTAEGAAAYQSRFFADSVELEVVSEGTALALAKPDPATFVQYPIFVGDTQVTSLNCNDILHDGGTVRFEPDVPDGDEEVTSGTLKLNNATIEMGGLIEEGFCIVSELADLTIELNGKNRIGNIVNYREDTTDFGDYKVTCGIYEDDGNLTFTGKGDLTIYDSMYGIAAYNSDDDGAKVTFDKNFKGTLKIEDLGDGGYACAINVSGNVTIENGTFDLVSYLSNGIKADQVIINGCKKIEVKGLDDLNEWREGCYSINADTLTIAENLVIENAEDVDNPESGYTVETTKLKSAKGKAPVVIKDPTSPAPSGGGSTPTVTVPVSGDKDSVKISATVSGSNATIKNVTSEQLETVGTGDNVVVDLSGVNKSVTAVTIPKTTFDNVAASEASGLEVKFPDGTVAVFDSTTVAAVSEQAAGSNIQLVVDQKNKAEQALNAAQKDAIKGMKNALVLDAYFVSSGKRISDFKGGSADLTVSYPTTKPVRVWYVAADGTMELVPSSYDGKTATFTVTHFSHYVIEVLDGSSYANCPKDETCVLAKFADVKLTEWYHDGMHYCVENGMMNGVTETEFAPKATLTRGMVVAVLARLNGVETIKGNSWYVPGMEWAMANGISDGTNMTANITREQLATMLYRYALLKKVDVDEITKDTNTLSHNDVFTISDWATSGMHFCIAAGVVNGDDKGNLNPHNTATRAEAAAMFQRFCEKVTK